MSLRDVFRDTWEFTFPNEPIPTNLAFLEEESENLASLASVLDTTESTINKLRKELSKQQFIFDFVYKRLNSSLATRARGISPNRHSFAGDVGDDSRRTGANSKLGPRTSYGHPVRAQGQGAAAQFTALMAKFGFGNKINRPAIDPEDEDDAGIRRPTALSRFYDKSSMLRASSEPSLLDSNVKYRPQPPLPSPSPTTSSPHDGLSTSKSLSPYEVVNFSNIAARTGLRGSRNSARCAAVVDSHIVSDRTNSGGANQYLETDIDDGPLPSSNAGAPPLPPPMVDRTSRHSSNLTTTTAKPSRRPRENVYEEPIEFRRTVLAADSLEKDEDEVANSSDEEPLYFNILLLKEQTLKQATKMYVTVTPPSEASEPVIRRRAHRGDYEDIVPSMRSERCTDDGSADGVKGDEQVSPAWKRQSMELAMENDVQADSDDQLDVVIPLSADQERLHMRETVIKCFLESEHAYINILEALKQMITKLSSVKQTAQHMISSEDVNVVFFKITDLHMYHKYFVAELETQVKLDLQTSDHDMHVALPFHKLATLESQVAAPYSTNFEKAITAIRRCKQNSPAFVELTKAVYCKSLKRTMALEEMIREPIERFEKLRLILQDIIKFTPTSHSDYDSLHKTLNIVQKYLCQRDSSTTKDQTENARYLVDNGLVVEQVGTTRKMRHLFLFNDVLICACQKISGRERITYELKWFIPLKEVHVDDTVSQEERLLLESRQQEVDALQHKVSNLRSDLKIEMKRAKQSSEAQRQSSLKGHAKSVEKIKEKLMKEKAALILASPCLPLRLSQKNKSYTLLMASDYERTNWRAHIEGLQTKSQTSQSLTSLDAQNILTGLKLSPRQSTMQALLGTDDFSLEEEYVFGSLCITIISLQGLVQPEDVYCCAEVDSFGHFFMKAKTCVIQNCQMPRWDADFEIDLDGAQTLRILCYKKENDVSHLIGKGAFELYKDKLHGQPTNEDITLDNGMTLQTSMSYRSRQQTLKRTLSCAKEGLFGVKLRTVLRREGSKIPLIVTSCVREIESRGMKDLGLYRVSGVLAEIQKLKKAFEKNSRVSVSLLKSADTNVIAGLLKVYLRELPEALFTDELYPKMVAGMAIEEPEAKEMNMRRLISTLNDCHYPTAMYILDHLIKVSEQETENKMTLQNLATVFGPTLLRPGENDVKKQSPEELLPIGARDALKQIEILYYILKLKLRGTFGVRL